MHQLLDYEAAAARLNTSPRHVRELAYRRELGFVKVGRLVRFRAEDLDAYVAARTVNPRRSA
jgi:excisionase family DNA binding protein